MGNHTRCDTVRGWYEKVTDRPIGLKEHRNRAPADVGPRHLASRTTAAVRCATVKTACKKLFSVSRFLFFEHAMLTLPTLCRRRGAAHELQWHKACGEGLPGSCHAADIPRALCNGLHRHRLHQHGPDGDGSLRASTEQRQRYKATFRGALHGSSSSMAHERFTVVAPC